MTYIKPKETTMSSVTDQIRREYEPTIKAIRERHAEYRQRVDGKRRAEAAYREAEAHVPSLQSQRDGLFSEFQRASFEENAEAIKDVSKRRKDLDKAIGAAEKARDKARKDFERVDFPEDRDSYVVWKQGERDAAPVLQNLRDLGNELTGDVGQERHRGLIGELLGDIENAVHALRNEHYAVRRETSGMESVAYQEELEAAA